ncbi:hypothetical protein RB195_009466 [Necator americanus]|uniref:Uncharacterized protein n=1 Tax=Necator americanus TaxID=51031 RepID=A0ABR1CTF3_NECAM
MSAKYRFCLFLATFMAIINEDKKVSAQLLPPFGPNSRARSSKQFKNGVVSCGETFCDAEKCVKLKIDGKTTYSCNE